jgi:hypothetical protein
MTSSNEEDTSEELVGDVPSEVELDVSDEIVGGPVVAEINSSFVVLLRCTSPTELVEELPM